MNRRDIKTEKGFFLKRKEERESTRHIDLQTNEVRPTTRLTKKKHTGIDNTIEAQEYLNALFILHGHDGYFRIDRKKRNNMIIMIIIMMIIMTIKNHNNNNNTNINKPILG